MSVSEQQQSIDSAVTDVYAVAQSARDADSAAGAILKHVTPSVVKTDMPFAFLESAERLDTLKWAESLVSNDARFTSLRPAQELFARLAHVPPYDTRANDGWEAIVAIAIAAQQFDFLTNREFALNEIQRRVRIALLNDQMIERTVWALFGVRVASTIAVGERAWIVPPTDERRDHVAVPSQPGYPLIHAHSYLVVDRVASSEELRTANRDPLPPRLIKSLRAVARADLRASGPWVEALIMFPSRFAGFRTFVQKPTLPQRWWIPNDDLEISEQVAAEAVALNALLDTEPPKLKANVRSLQLAINRLATANSRDDASDEFLDLMIALEALLSKDGEKTEINYRIALRGAFLGSVGSAEGRAATRKMLQVAYNLRSEIVHGAKRDPEIGATALCEFRSFVGRVIRLSAHAIAQGQPLVEQIEATLLGDTATLNSTIAKMNSSVATAAPPDSLSK